MLSLDNSTFEKASKCAMSTSFLIKSTANDASVGLFRVQEHINKRVPYLQEEKRKLKEMQTQVERALADIGDIDEAMNEYDDVVDTLDRTLFNLERAVELAQTREKRPASATRTKKMLRSMSDLLGKSGSTPPNQ